MTCCNRFARNATWRTSAKTNERFFRYVGAGAGVYGDHIHHKASLDFFIRFEKSTGGCGAHSLAEIYSTLTRMPGEHRIGGEQAMLFIGGIRERLSLSRFLARNMPTHSRLSQIAASWEVECVMPALAQCAIEAQAEILTPGISAIIRAAGQMWRAV